MPEPVCGRTGVRAADVVVGEFGGTVGERLLLVTGMVGERLLVTGTVGGATLVAGVVGG